MKISIYRIYVFSVVCLVGGLIFAPLSNYQNDFLNIISIIGVLGIVFCLSLKNGALSNRNIRDVPKKENKNHSYYLGLLAVVGIFLGIINAILAVSFLFFKDCFNQVFEPTMPLPPIVFVIIFGLLIPLGNFVGKKFFTID